MKKIQEFENYKWLQLSFVQYISHFFISFFLLAIIISIISITIDKQDNNTDFYIFISILALYTIFVINKILKLKFKKILIRYTNSQIDEAIKRTVKKLNWSIVEYNNVFFQAKSVGELITIVKIKNGLLINSICKPEKYGSVISFRWNKKNIKIFENNLKEVKNEQV